MTTLGSTPVAARFAAPALLQIGPPPTLATVPVATLSANAKADLVARCAAVGIAYNVAPLETDPGVILSEAAAYRDSLRRVQIDQAIAQTYLGSATGPFLDTRAADYGCLRKTFADPTPTDTSDPGRPSNIPYTWTFAPAGSALAARYLSGAAGWVQDDTSFRQLAFLAWGALSVAGPSSAYAYLAMNADPDVYDVVVDGPETGYVSPGQVLVLIQSYDNGGIPSIGVLQAVGAALDAAQITDCAGNVTTYPVRNPAVGRPIGAEVLVEAPQSIAYSVTATIYITAGNDPTATLASATARLAAFQAARQYIGMSVPLSGLIAALSITDANGLPTVDEVAMSSPTADVAPAYNQLAVAGAPTLTVVVR